MGDLDGYDGEVVLDNDNGDDNDVDFGWRQTKSRRLRTIIILSKLCRIVEYNEKSQVFLEEKKIIIKTINININHDYLSLCLSFSLPLSIYMYICMICTHTYCVVRVCLVGNL
jgi:hypothetical protein